MDDARLTRLTHCHAPAKLNLFLHVIGRRSDGYHLLQSAFQLLDWGDSLHFERRSDSQIRRSQELPGIAHDADLCLRAARLLQSATGCTLGADITLDKQLPLGGGLGGGSSDAATTLIALNRLWDTGLKRPQLAKLGLQLGADVPFFIHGSDAFVEGIGEIISPVTLPENYYVILFPGVHIPTAEIFRAMDLTKASKALKIADFASRETRNDLQGIACKLYPEVAAAVEWLEAFAPARMTGSGACVFAAVDSEEAASAIIAVCPPRWQAWKARSLPRHPLHAWLEG